jgi:hypothetical protein
VEPIDTLGYDRDSHGDRREGAEADDDSTTNAFNERERHHRSRSGTIGTST